jgi:hypothetical protein
VAVGQSPYQSGSTSGPIDAITTGAYLYPPTLADLLVLPGRLLGGPTAALIWRTMLGAAGIAAALIGWRAGGGRRSLIPFVLLLWSLPLFQDTSQGNVSSLMALAVAIALWSGPGRRAGAALAAAAVIKVVPLLAFPAALAAGKRRAAEGMLVVGLVLVAIPALLRPADWLETPRVLLNLNAGNVNNVYNMAAAAWLTRYLGFSPGVETFLRLLTLALVAGLVTLSVWYARRPNGWLPAITAVVIAWLLVSPQLWYHYLAALVPIEAALLAQGDRTTRVVTSAAVGLFLGVFVGPMAWAGMALLLLAAIRISRVPIPTTISAAPVLASA